MSAQTSGISNSTLIHAGIEIVVAVAIVYWVHSRNKDIQDQTSILSERIDKLEEVVKKQAEIIAHHENALRQFHTMMQGIPNTSSQKISKSQASRNKNDNIQNRKNVEKTMNKPHVKEQFEEEDIDDELMNEIEDLENEAGCVGEECEVFPENKKK